MNYETEFKVVELILASDLETRGADAFSLSILKMERQIRRIFTHLIYQCPEMDGSEIWPLINALADNKKIYFRHFIEGINSIYPKTVEEIYGNNYQETKSKIDSALNIRNKLFHGQLTGENLSRGDLIEIICHIGCWCSALANAFQHEIGYDGFARDSYQKSSKPEMFKDIRWPFTDIEEYSDFLVELQKRA
jgi:hypothetical protein